MISKILVAYDGTKCAERALVFGLDLAEKYSAPMVILNVLEIPAFGTPEDPAALSVGIAGLIKDMRTSHQQILSKAAEKAIQLKPSVNVSSELREGTPADQIVAAASEGGFDVVVLGHGGEGRLREMFMGGTSERVAHMARCAVLIAK